MVMGAHKGRLVKLMVEVPGAPPYTHLLLDPSSGRSSRQLAGLPHR